jgi:hypothetical protein
MTDISKKYKIEFLNNEGEVVKTEYTNTLKKFALSKGLNYYHIRELLNDKYKNKKRGQQKYGQELRKKIKITQNQIDFSSLFDDLN